MHARSSLAILPSALAASAAILALSGCQTPYLLKSAWSQMSLLNSRESIDSVLASGTIDAETRRKLELAREAKRFAETDLGLKNTKNYDTFVQLDRPYVSYVVSAAPRNRLEPYTWWFPFVGSVPYKGYFNPHDAEMEAQSLAKEEDLDVYVRGVSAYSTLGWFNDPVLSSMLRYSDYDLVSTIIHETTHATLFIKSNAEFNERLATFVGTIGADLFYRQKQGGQSSEIKQAHDENADEKLFSEFISGEIEALEAWYKNAPSNLPASEFLALRQKRLSQISEVFETKLAPNLKSKRYVNRLRAELSPSTLNNAKLLLWRLYIYDPADFDRAFNKLGGDPKKFIEFAKSLETKQDPEAELKAFAGP